VRSWKRHLWAAIIAGLSVSLTLGRLNFKVHPDHHRALSNLLFVAQYPGWFACARLLPGSFESMSTTNYVGIAVPTNAAFYAIVIFTALRLLSRERPN